MTRFYPKTASHFSESASVLSRRAMLAGLPLLGACSQTAAYAPEAVPQNISLKDKASFPLGNIATVARLSDPVWAGLIRKHFDRLTPEWQMKTEYMLQSDGSLKFDAPDAILSFAQANGLAVFGHVLVWYAQDQFGLFPHLKTHKADFAKAYDAYIGGVVDHYKGRLAGWDVVNEAIDDEGLLRPCLYAEVLGEDYIRQAFETAHAHDPAPPLFINDYNLEYYPKKRHALMRRVEGLLKTGVPIHGIGTQTHIAADLQPGALKACIADLASLGLKVHVSEVDVSLLEASKNPLSFPDLRLKQTALYEELVEAYQTIKPEQQFGMTFWGLRDQESWKNKASGPIRDEPLLFDDQGQLKPIASGLIMALR